MIKGKSKHQATRREFVKKAGYIAPAIITLQVAPMYAKAGSVKKEKKDEDDQGEDEQ